MNTVLKIMAVYLPIALVLSVCGRNPEIEKEAAGPNIVLILVDDLGKEWVGCYGAEDILTPNIDILAKSGMLFNNVYAMPQCTPSRATLLTGQYPFRHGWVNHWDVPRWGGGAHFDETQNPSLGIEMKKAGYATAIAGKWQIDDFRVEPDALTKNGFDDYCMWTGYEDGNPPSGERYQDAYIHTKEGSETHSGAFGPDIFKNFIFDFIDRNKASPMFIYYPMVLVHTPFVNTPDESAGDDLGKHKAMVRYTDKITGEIVQALDRAGVRENTIVIWTTDNGTAGQITGNYRGRAIVGGESRTTEPGINMPFIVSWPKRIKPNSTSDALIDFSDIFPTCLDLASIEPKTTITVKNKTHTIDGKSFKSVLTDGALESERKWILGMGGKNNARLTENGVENEYNFRDRVLRDARYKVYIDTKRQPEEFYDLVADPSESNNLIDSLNTDERRKHFDELFSVVKSFPLRDNDPIYKPNPIQPWDVAITAKSQIWKK